MKRNVFDYGSSDSEEECFVKRSKRLVKSNEGSGKNSGEIKHINGEFHRKEEGFEDDDEDYMSMVISPGTPAFRSRQSKASLDIPILSDSIGLKIMQKMGFKIGGTLGRQDNAKSSLMEPLSIRVKTDRKGIGSTTFKVADKSKFNPATVEKYRLTSKDKHAATRNRKILEQLQRFCFHESGDDVCISEDPEKIGEVNVMWRKCAKELISKPKGRKLLFNENVSKAQEVSSSSEGVGNDNGIASESSTGTSTVKESVESDQFDSLTTNEQLLKLLTYSRQAYFYCPYCSVRYEDEKDMQDNCPGPFETDHPY